MKQLLAWALYDLANTFFAVTMLSFFFPLWVVEDKGAKDFWFGLAVSCSMGCVALVMPVCGAISDATDTRMRYLRWTTFGCVAATLWIGFLDTLWFALILFAFANICYQLGTVFYDTLLWHVARPTRLGEASGFGAAFGYLGSMVGILCLWPFVHARGHQATFAPSAILFLLFALPSFLMIREPAAKRRLAWGPTLRAACRRFLVTIRRAERYAGLWRFFIASFFSLSAINTVLFFMAVYMRKVLGFNLNQLIFYALLGQASSVASSLLFSRVIGWLGSKRALALVWTGWAVALALASMSRDPRWLWVIAPLIGLCLGPTWATSRVLIVELAPKSQLAEFIGLAGLLGRASSIPGLLLWGAIVWDPSRYRQALVALLGLLVIGLWILRKVPDPRALPTR